MRPVWRARFRADHGQSGDWPLWGRFKPTIHAERTLLDGSSRVGKMLGIMTRNDAWNLLTEFTQSESLRKHALSVEACMRAYSRKFGEDEDKWAVTGLIHDFDYEKYPTASASLTLSPVSRSSAPTPLAVEPPGVVFRSPR